MEDDRLANHRSANYVRQDLEDTEFDTGRYVYKTDVKPLPANPNYTEELRNGLSDGHVVHDTENFDTVQTLILHGEIDRGSW